MGTEILPVRDRKNFQTCYVMLPDGTVRPPIDMHDYFYWNAMGSLVFGWHMIARTMVGDVRVQTDFLSIDHGLPLDIRFVFDPSADIGYAMEVPIGYVPTCFETMVFGGPLHGETRRFKTLEEARYGHQIVVLHVIRALALEVEGILQSEESPP